MKSKAPSLLRESAAFITGDGVNKPKGLLDYTIVDDASHAWGQIGAVTSGGPAISLRPIRATR